jgi:hypothetical protein
VSVALDLDFSESISSVLNDIKESAKGFIRNLITPGDEASVIKFAREVVVEPIGLVIGFVQVDPDDPTDPADPNNLLLFDDAIDHTFPGEPDATKLFDAVFNSIDSLGPRLNDRTAALVVSDGVDYDSVTRLPASTQDLEDVIANAQAKQVFIFTIGLGADIQTEVLQRMAVETGGQYFASPNSADLTSIYNQISDILTNQYEITFTTSQAPGTAISLRVVATNGLLTGDATVSAVY